MGRRGVAVGENLGSLCREPPKLILFALGNPGNEGAPALAGGGEMVRKVTFDLKLSLRLAGSPPPSTEGGKGCTVALNVGRLSCSRRFVGKVSFPLESHKESFVDPCAPRRLVLSVSLCSTSKTSQQLFRHKRVFVYKA